MIGLQKNPKDFCIVRVGIEPGGTLPVYQIAKWMTSQPVVITQKKDPVQFGCWAFHFDLQLDNNPARFDSVVKRLQEYLKG
jgi:hypothetical protein